MCGIVGWVGALASGGIDPMEAALTALAPRGPDGTGRTEGRLGARPVRLGVRRLELVDPGRPSQPVEGPGGSLLVFNGEVYNHGELRRGLAGRGASFRTGSDAEVLARLLAEEGVAGLSRVEGSYAFAFLAGPQGPLLLGRDPRGVRPLVAARLPQGLVFASTVTALLATGAVGATADLDALAAVLRDGVVPGNRTAIDGVFRVAPGEVLSFDEGLQPTSLVVAEAEGEPGDVLEALRSAVHDRWPDRRPGAVFLSGGVDSALVAALAREKGPVVAHTLVYPGHAPADEGHRARRTARRLGLEHVEVPCPRDPTAWVLGAAEAFDEPFADASAVPTWGLASAAGRRVRVALTGTGGDETFGGYRRYWLLGAGPWLRHVPSFLRASLRVVLGRNLPQGARLLDAAADPEGLYRGLLRLQPHDAWRRLLGPRLLSRAEPPPRPEPTTPSDAMAADLEQYLPDDLLVKEDRALMAHGVEGRHPFLDRRVRAAARALTLTGRPGRAQQKRVLRAYVAEVVEPDLARAPKRGFSFPVDALYRGPLRPLAEEVVYGRSMRERGLVAPAGAVQVLKEHLRQERDAGAVLHAIVMLELWSRRVLGGAP
jgi:asparagine synthase (glutamine-hydrolysing)